MKMEFTTSEAQLLLEVLKDRLGLIREEIYHSTTYEFTEELKGKEKLLRGLIQKVETATGSAGEHASTSS